MKILNRESFRERVRHAKLNQRSAVQKGISGGAILLLAVLVVVFLYYNNAFCAYGYCPTNLMLANQQAANHNAVSLPGGPYNAQVAAYNALTGAAITSATTQNIYASLASPNKLDSSSSTSNPIQFGSQIYQNGGSYFVQLGKSTLATTLTPFYPSTFAPLTGGTTYQTLGNVYTVTTPTFTLSGSWNNGTTFTTSQSYNFTSGTQSATQTVKFNVGNSAANTGWISAWDPANQQTTNVVCVINDTTTGQNLGYSGYGNLITKGSGYYYTYIVPDGWNYGQGTSPDGQPTTTLTRAAGSTSDISNNGITTYQPISTGPITGQGYIFSITVQKGSLSHGSSEAMGVECYQGADVTVFNGGTYHYGNFGPDAVAKITFAITWKN